MAAGILIRVDAGAALPIYRQIVEQVKAAIASGVLSPGDRLPSHRDLAHELVVAPLTVSRAYEQLEREGFLATARGKGTFVTTSGSAAAAVIRQRVDWFGACGAQRRDGSKQQRRHDGDCGRERASRGI